MKYLLLLLLAGCSQSKTVEQAAPWLVKTNVTYASADGNFILKTFDNDKVSGVWCRNESTKAEWLTTYEYANGLLSRGEIAEEGVKK